ncbi:ABC transporter ATP-binding protein [Fervidobacterium thailandense]|uniref:ABC transporter n=1 Tax=Fervidobacterium thailandense TaxID=1008305 RepID=A0A1E3G1G9_9BACT|nr:ABC transporter ATP-binding protein [Fervidobacterium thailandense]ODN30114.1 ABC transporter [Fervidobacterium thailandense]
MTVEKFLLKVLKKYQFIYILSILFSLLAVVFSRLVPLIVKLAVDYVLQEGEIKSSLLRGIFELFGGREFLLRNFWFFGVLVVLASFFNGLFSYFRDKFSATVGESVARDLRTELHSTILRAEFSFYGKHQTGDVIQRCTSDVDTVRQFVSQDLIAIWRNLFMLIFVYYVMFSLSPFMTGISSIFIPVLIISAFLFYKKVEKDFVEIEEAEGELTTTLQESLSGIRVVKAFGREDFEKVKFFKRNSHYRERDLSLLKKMAIFWTISDFMALAQVALVIFVGTYLVVKGSLTLGTLVVFSTYVWLLLWPVREFGILLSRYGRVRIALSRILEIVSAEKEEVKSKEGVFSYEEFRGEIEFRDVWFSYDGQNDVLKGVSFKILAGETVAFFGPTGSGKSTIIALLLRLVKPQKGQILLDGVDIEKIPLQVLRRVIGVVPQESFLFSKTIRENVTIAKGEAPLEEVVEVCKTAAIHDDILGFKDGYETVVGERGVTLSGGQRQRLCIARTLILDHPVLVFDDSMSAVDTDTERRIRERIGEFRGKKTVIVISHRISSVKDADRIFVIENGTITDAGTHEELIKREGLYAKVWKIERLILEEERGVRHRA